MKVFAIAACLGIGIGSAAFAACSESFDFPVPCQGTAAIRCPSDCTTTYSGPTRANCVSVTSGCCQWRENTFTCSGGSCGSSCTSKSGAHEFVIYRPYWECVPHANGTDRTCKPPEPGPGDPGG